VSCERVNSIFMHNKKLMPFNFCCNLQKLNTYKIIKKQLLFKIAKNKK